MAKTTEQKLVLSAPKGAKITKANLKISADGKSVKFIIVSELVDFDDIFPIFDQSELIGHKLLEHKPEGILQEKLLADIRKGINMKLPAFRAPCMDPSEKDGKIVFEPGNRPAVGHSATWWKETWKNFMPSKNSRIGTDLHRAVFLGKLMKYLVDDENYSVEEAWKAVCNDSRDLGHYRNSKDAKHDFEPTGSRKIGIFCDLANTCKLFESWDLPILWIASGYYGDYSDRCPLAVLDTITVPVDVYKYSVSWPVLDV